jgi:hypothetical protein
LDKGWVSPEEVRRGRFEVLDENVQGQSLHEFQGRVDYFSIEQRGRGVLGVDQIIES